MITHYIKIALRTLLRNKIFSLVTILGFAIGIAVCIFIVLLILDAVSYDRFHENADRIYRVTVESEFSGEVNNNAITSPPVGPTLLEYFVEIEDYVRIRPTRYPSELLVVYDDKRFYEEHIVYADGTIFDIFTFPLTEGDPATALREPYSVVITEFIAHKYFGDDDPLYKTIDINNELYTITGIAQNVPENSHIQFDFILSYATLPYQPSDWMSLHLYTFILLREGYTVESIEGRMETFVERNVHPPDWIEATIHNFHLQPLTNIYLFSNLKFELSDSGMIRYIYLYGVIAFCILLVACINYMNLSTARYTKRTREVGLRRVLGAQRNQLVRQFLGETFILTFMAFIIALTFIELFLPSFENLIGKSIAIQYYDNIFIIGILSLLMLWIAVLAGIYPAVFLSSFKTIDILRNKLEIGKGKTLQLSIRRYLVSMQFILSIGLIASTIIIYQQLMYMRTANLGFEKEQVVIVPTRDRDIRAQSESFKHELLKHIYVYNVSISSEIPGRLERGHPIHPEGIDYDGFMRVLSVDFEFLDLFEMEMAAGRPFKEELATDARDAFILNESAARELGWIPAENAIGKRFSVSGIGGVTRTGQVVGVVSDFHFKSLHHRIEPLVIMVYPRLYRHFSVKIGGENIPESIRFIESKWNEFAPYSPFEYFFLDDDFDRLYKADMQTASIIGSFSFFVIFISCLGLLGLSTFAVEQRTKEIGIRKVLGASTGTILKLLWTEFTKLVLISGIIAIPIAYYIIQKWLENFAYRINILIDAFIISIAIVLLLSMVTISFQTIKAAIANPVDSLRYE